MAGTTGGPGGRALWGAATHDLGKALVPAELSGPGREHEAVGRRWLEEQGVAPALARFAETHGTAWDEGEDLEDLLVALADAVWKGSRVDRLEARVVAALSRESGAPGWEVFGELDSLLEKIAAVGHLRLEVQGRFPVHAGGERQ